MHNGLVYAPSRRVAARTCGWTATGILAGAAVLVPAVAAQEQPRPVTAWPEAIEDNSFLIEEAYNQEPGVVQFIFNFQRSRPGGDWLASFTNEWPAPGEQHQLSYTVPYTFGAGPHPTEVGDILVNYRYQALDEEKAGVAFAPRFTLSLPTGSAAKGLGMGVTGYQVSFPFSKRLSRGLAVHVNLGATWWPGVVTTVPGAPSATRDVSALDEGMSAVWLLTPRFNLFLEGVAYQTQTPPGTSGSGSGHLTILNPGLRAAFNFPTGQLVVGASAPFGVSAQGPDPSVFLYLSWEMPIWHPRP
jgi:hypothetical protein